MAREKMVTRTIDFTVADIMTVDVTTAAVSNTSVQVAGKYVGNELLGIVRSMIDTETVKVVTVTATHTETKLYGMSESDFLKYGKVLPPRTKAEQETEQEQAEG